uniref:Uncharacterized protein n=1 Tax=viral metagenome TaxID=1070528 RepID=A0A6M3IDV8_9ZZZZ
MKIVPLDKENIDIVFNDLWDIGKKEIALFDESVESKKESFIKMIGLPFTGALCDDNDQPCALVALKRENQFKWTSNFVAIEGGFRKIYVHATSLFIKISDRIVSNRVSEIEIRSAYKFGKPSKWFEFMGFKYEGGTRTEHYYVKR